MRILTVFVMVTLFTFGENARIDSSHGGENEGIPSKLRIISVSTERIEAEYYEPTGGIHIFSEVSSSGDAVRVRISTTSGKSLFAVDRTYSSGLVSIVGSEFLLLNETSSNGENKLTEYLVPPNYSKKVMNALKHDRVSKVLRHLSSEAVNATASSAVEELLARPEVLLIKDAAFALGSTGLRGADNPAAMAFCATALHFTNALTVEEEGVASGELEDGATPERLLSKKRVRRWGWLDPSPTVWCSNSRSHCVNCPVGEKCYGLCGPGCTCWWIFCGDCCWNTGCNWHDRYACSNGRNTLACWLTAPVALACTSGL